MPTQSCHRFTDKNLTSWLYKTGQLKKKPRYEGPDRRIQRTKGGLNVDFFKKWSAKMAYVLGYFAADRCMYENPGRSKFINFVSTDYEILKKVKRILSPKHQIVPKIKYNPNCKSTFWIQIGCKEVYEDIIKLGLVPRKELRLNLPRIPSRYFRDFVRGYFDGDECISYGLYKRKNRKSKILALTVRFASGSKKFLYNLKNQLKLEIHLNGGSLINGDKCCYLSL